MLLGMNLAQRRYLRLSIVFLLYPFDRPILDRMHARYLAKLDQQWAALNPEFVKVTRSGVVVSGVKQETDSEYALQKRKRYLNTETGATGRVCFPTCLDTCLSPSGKVNCDITRKTNEWAAEKQRSNPHYIETTSPRVLLPDAQQTPDPKHLEPLAREYRAEAAKKNGPPKREYTETQLNALRSYQMGHISEAELRKYFDGQPLLIGKALLPIPGGGGPS